MFLDYLTAITQIESRLQEGKPLSRQEIAGITLFFDLNSERIPSPPSSENLVQLLYSDLHTYIENLNRDFVIKINFLETELSKWLIVYHKNNSFDETRRALRKQCAVEEPAIGVGCWAKQATHHAVKSWWW